MLAAALKELWAVEANRIATLMLGKMGYTAAPYACAAVQLMNAKHHAVPKREMREQLGRQVVGPAASEVEAEAAGETVLQHMVAANALSVRPWSTWARDIPIAAFKSEVMVVTAPSAMDLYCINRLRPRLVEVLEHWDKVGM